MPDQVDDSLELSQLPAETIIAVFSALPNFTDAYNFAAVSRRFRAIFLESSISISKAIASHSRDLSLAGRQLLRAQALVSTFRSASRAGPAYRRPYSDVVHDFIKAEVHNNSHATLGPPYGKPFSLADVSALQANWRVVSALEPAILSQVQAAKPFLDKFGMWKAGYAIPTTVTWQDRTRIHNALYRLWTYQTLFYHREYRPAFYASGHESDEASLIDSHRKYMPAHVRYLTSTTFSSDGIELHEVLLLWTSIIHNRLFTLTHLSLAIEVAMGAAILIDHQGQPVPQAQGRVFHPTAPSIVSRLRRPPHSGALNSPRRVAATNEIIAVVTFLNQWPTNQWTMPRHEERIPAFLKGLVRMLTPPDMLLFLNPSPHEPVPYTGIRELAERVQQKFDNWEDPSTGRATMEKWLNRWYKFPVYEAWGSFLFALEGTRAAFMEDWIGLPMGVADGLLWEEDLSGKVNGGRDEWVAGRIIGGRELLWKEEWERFYVK
ncbi:hypothetical protein L211DRAFT_845308 [Terfezia boudieri ATCC MYA-4762]|uniref:F-box domain-containing protein n=1 Tax=Terfezia boudieri ATCC MYA-4762 TaxID=1051890 RepID=A0A3N4M484_9PEZI|nr:hypothetical protein L211DRAFT_845308 [Terfezia boudieri ATCC MYA-4762]